LVYRIHIYRILDGCEEIWILCSSGKNNISRVSAANEWDIVLDTRT
jgi:antirestriction protein